MPQQLKLTPSQMAGLLFVEYGSREEMQDERLEAALRRIRGRPDKSEAFHIASSASAVVSAGFLALSGEGSISLEVGRQKKLGLLPVGHVMIAKRGETSFASGSLEGELSNRVGSKPQRAYELLTSWLPPSANPFEGVVRFAIDSIETQGPVERKLEEARPHLPDWCEQFSALLRTDLGLKLRLEANNAMRSRMPKGPETIDLSWLPGPSDGPG